MNHYKMMQEIVNHMSQQDDQLSKLGKYFRTQYRELCEAFSDGLRLLDQEQPEYLIESHDEFVAELAKENQKDLEDHPPGEETYGWILREDDAIETTIPFVGERDHYNFGPELLFRSKKLALEFAADKLEESIATSERNALLLEEKTLRTRGLIAELQKRLVNLNRKL